MAAPEVVFSAPVPNDTEVERNVRVRIQFSRDVDPRTIDGHVTVTYVPPAGGTAPPPPAFTTAYNDVAHAIEIRFAQPLERFQQVKVEITEGVVALDRQPVKPWTLIFTTGGT